MRKESSVTWLRMARVRNQVSLIPEPHLCSFALILFYRPVQAIQGTCN